MRRSLVTFPRSAVVLAILAGGVAIFVACSSKKSNQTASGDGGSGPSCGDDETLLDGGDDGPNVLTPCAWDQPVTQPSDDAATAGRAACMYTRGAMPESTLGPSTPLDDSIPIDNIVVVMMENHSFDSYLGHLNQYANRTDIESADAGATNPDVDGAAVPWIHAPHPCSADTNHEWAGTHQEIDDGKMDGFVTTNNGWSEPTDAAVPDASLYSGARAMWWYDQTDLPTYYTLASTFALADHYHCSVPGPTWPNRMYLYAATSFGETTNVFPDISAYPYPSNDASILDELEKRHVTWLLYSDGAPGAGTVYGAAGATRWGRTILGNFKQFQTDAAAGNLPQVSFVDPNLDSETNGGAGTDEHPPGDIQSGELFVAQVAQAVMSSPQWAHTALFITHDENGGFYDHVAPPSACAPDSTQPILVKGDETVGGFDLYGIRVLLIAVSPYAKKGYVGHQVYDHTSIARFIEAKFKIPALTARDANALPPTDLFDFTDPPAFLTPPTLATPVIDPTQLTYCESTFGK
ncbi:MAG: alkaline phosphatase family protein [Polyangiaceae bacterium]|jgi:phospholipase C